MSLTFATITRLFLEGIHEDTYHDQTYSHSSTQQEDDYIVWVTRADHWNMKVKKQL